MGHSIIVSFLLTGSNTATGCSDNQSPANTYTKVASATGLNGTQSMYVYEAYVATAAGTFTTQCALASAGNSYIELGEWVGLSTTINVDGTPTANYVSSSTTCATGNITTSHAADLVYGGLFTVGTPVTAGGWTVVVNSGSPHDMFAFYQATSSASVYNPTSTVSSATLGYCIGVALW